MADISQEAIEEMLRAIQSSNGALPDFSSDALTQEFIAKLSEEIAKQYSLDSDDEGDDEDESDYETGSEYTEEDEDSYEDSEELSSDGEDYDGSDYEEESGDERSGRADTQKSTKALPTVKLRKGPKPIDLWRAVHEAKKPERERVVMTEKSWQVLVNRLNDTSKRKLLLHRRAQQRQDAEALTGLTFQPAISEKSRVMAAQVKSLPDRVNTLMKKKQAKIARIRAELDQKELAEATFKPNLNRNKSAISRVPSQNRHTETGSRITHLLQYDIDRKLRAEQRRILIDEMQEKNLTFAPNINPNSRRIVERLAQESRVQDNDGSGVGIYATHKSAVRSIRKEKPGRSWLPGHEEETFHPKINPRSRALKRTHPEENVFERLHSEAPVGQKPIVVPNTQEPGLFENTAVYTKTGLLPSKKGIVVGSDTTSRLRATSAQAKDGKSEKNQPDYVNRVAYDATKHSFILQKLITP